MDPEGILNRLPVVIYLLDSDSGEVSYLSEGVARFLGHVPDLSAATAEWRSHIHPDDVAITPTLDARRRSEGRPFGAEYRMVTPDGETVWVREDAILIPGDGSRGAFWQGMVTDVTRRKEVEEDSWRSAARFRAIIEELPAIVYMNSLDIPPMTTYISPRLEAVLGVKPEEWVENRRLWEGLAHPDDLERMLAEDVADYPDGRYQSEFRMMSRDGREVWFHDEAVLVRDEEGNPTHWEGVLVDISDQKAAEAREREAEERYRSLVERVPAVLYTDASQGDETLYVSPQIEAILGVLAGEYMEDHDLWAKMLHPDDRERVLAQYDEFRRGTGGDVDDYRMVRPDGRVVWIRDRARIERDPAGGVVVEQGMMFDVTEQKEAEERERQAETRFKTLVETLPAIAYISTVGQPEKLLYVSPRIEELLGKSIEEWQRDPDYWDAMVHPDDRARIDELSKAANETGRFSAEYRLTSVSETPVWVRDEGVLVRDEDGTPLYWEGLISDITELKKTEIELERARESWKDLVDRTPTPIYIEELDGTARYISPLLRDLTGYSPEEWMSSREASWRNFLHPDDRDRVLAEERRVDESLEPFSIDYRIFHKDGHIVWLHDEAVVVRDPDNEPLYWLGVHVDITARKEAEERLRETEERFRIFVEKGAGVVFIDGATDPWYTIYISPQVFDLFGWTQEEYLREQDLWDKALHPDDRERVLLEDHETGESGEPLLTEYRMINARGETLWIQERANMVLDADGAPLYWLGVFLDITEKKKAEAEIRRADARYRNLIDNIPVATYSQPYDTDSDIFMSPQIERITGWPVTTFARAESWTSVVHPDDGVPWTSEWADLADASHEPLDARYRIVKPDGTVVWVHDTALLVDATDDAPAMWQGVIEDITELKYTENELERARASWQDLVDQTPTPIYIEELEGGEMRYISPLIEGLLGYPPEEFTTRPGFIREVMHPDDGERFVHEDLETTEDQGYYESDYRVFHKEGHIVWMHDKSVLVRGANGEPLYWLGVVSDVTAQKEAEELLRAAEERYRSLIEQIPAILTVYPIGVDATAVYASPYSETLLGYPSDDWYGAGDLWVERLHPDDKARVLHLYERSLEARVDYSMEYRMMHKEGHAVWVEERGAFLPDENGDPMLVQSLIFDVTERKLAEQMTAELAAQTHELDHLRELDDMKSAFMSAVSHELRTPLTAMLGGALTLQSAGQSLPQKGYEDILNMIVQGGHQMGKLLTDLLDIERLSKGATRLQSRKGDIGEVVRSVIQECRVLEGHPLELDLPSVWMRLDNVKVERVVDNLLTNADRHTPDGTPIHVSVKPHEDGALIIVEDEGPGVPDDLKTVIFEAFRQGSAPAESPGIGVGLALVAKLSELHGGRAWVEDREGGGASFHVVLASLPEDT